MYTIQNGRCDLPPLKALVLRGHVDGEHAPAGEVEAALEAGQPARYGQVSQDMVLIRVGGVNIQNMKKKI